MAKEREFEPRGDTGFVEDIGEVALDGFLTQRELLGDIAIAAAFHDAPDHFKLARREAVSFALRNGGLLHQVVQRGHKIDDALAADPVIARVHGSNGSLQMAGDGIFEHDTARADVQCLDDLLRGDSGGKKQDLGRGRAVHDGAHCLKARQARHGHIEKQNIGLQLESLGDRLVAVGGVADDLKAFSFSKHVAHADADHRMVIRQHDSYWSFHLGCTPP